MDRCFGNFNGTLIIVYLGHATFPPSRPSRLGSRTWVSTEKTQSAEVVVNPMTIAQISILRSMIHNKHPRCTMTTTIRSRHGLAHVAR